MMIGRARCGRVSLDDEREHIASPVRLERVDLAAPHLGFWSTPSSRMFGP